MRHMRKGLKRLATAVLALMLAFGGMEQSAVAVYAENAGEEGVMPLGAKQTYTAQTISKEYISEKEYEESIDLSGYMPADIVSPSLSVYVDPDNDNFSYVAEYKPTISGSMLSYKVANNNQENMLGKITVTVKSSNYDDYIITVNLKVIPQKKVELKAGEVVTVDKTTMTYGELMSTISFTGTPIFVEKGTDTVVPGRLTWAGATNTAQANTDGGTGGSELLWLFTPDDSSTYSIYVGTIPITVYPAELQVTVPALADWSYKKSGLDVNDFMKGATVTYATDNDNNACSVDWAWADGTVTKVLEPGSHTEQIIGTVKKNNTIDTNYKKIVLTITFDVVKLTLDVGTITLSDYAHGDYLGEKVLSAAVTSGGETVSGTFVWKKPEQQLTYAADNGKAYEWIFIPDDSRHYNSAEGQTQIVVAKPEYPSNKPATVMNVSDSCGTLGQVTLPSGWEWVASVDTDLQLNTSRVFETKYNGADKDNYEKTTVEITVTRCDCEHAESTAIVTDSAPTCKTTGSGHTLCSICGKKVNDGITIPATGHSYQAGTPDANGICIYTCTNSGCTSSYKAYIPVSSSGSGSEGSGSGNSGSGSTGSGSENTGGGSTGSGSEGSESGNTGGRSEGSGSEGSGSGSESTDSRNSADSSSNYYSSGESGDTAASNVPAYVTYTVQRGDTLSKIAKKYNCTIFEIMAANSDLIKNPNRIYAGWQIKIPQSQEADAGSETSDAVYIVKKGDTLWAICKKYGCTIKEIIALNGKRITNPDLIYAGWELKIKKTN